MILAGPVLASYLTMCAPTVSADTMAAIVGVESGGNPFALNDNTTRRSYMPRDRATAVAIAGVLLRRGDNVDVGIAQVNSGNFSAFHASVASMLQPCANLTIASRILSGDYRTAASVFREPREALWHAISAYNTGSLFAGKPYVDAVVAEAERGPTVPTISLLTRNHTQQISASNVGLIGPAAHALEPAIAIAKTATLTKKKSNPSRAATDLRAVVRNAGIGHSLASGFTNGRF